MNHAPAATVGVPGLFGLNSPAVSAVAGGGGVEELDRAVEPLGVVKFRQVEPEFRPLVRRREAVTAEGVEVR